MTDRRRQAFADRPLWRPAAVRQAWRQRWHDVCAPLAAWWRQRAPRERSLLTLCAAILALAAVWLAGIEPALSRLAHWQAELPRLRAQASEIESLVQQARASRAVQMPAATSQALEQAISTSLDLAQLQGTYTLAAVPGKADGTRWLLTFSNAPVHALVPWLLQAPRGLGLAPVSVSLERPGVERPVPPGITPVPQGGQLPSVPKRTGHARVVPDRLSGTVLLAPSSLFVDKD